MESPGTTLKLLFQSVGIVPVPGCKCLEIMKRMNDWGVEGCKLHFAEIVTQLEQDAERYNWRKVAQATYLSAVNHYTFINPFNVIQSFVEEAIRICEKPPAGPDSLISSIGSR